MPTELLERPVLFAQQMPPGGPQPIEEPGESPEEEEEEEGGK
jgi:hypothetical protein